MIHMRQFRRMAVSSVIGGIIVLTLFLGAFTAMVLVGQQYDAYQNIAYRMFQKDIDRFSENLTAVSPGVLQISPSGCTQCEYDMFVSNQGGVAVQIFELYVNSTVAGTGCTYPPPATNIGPCVLTPSRSKANFAFNSNDAFVNAGEFNHTVRFWLPFSLPNPGPATPANTLWLTTGRGRVFSFQWPMSANPLAVPGFVPNLVRGSTKLAWTGSGGSPPVSNGAGCHAEGYETRPGPGNPDSLYFVNPWLDESVIFYSAKSNPTETIYVYIRVNNTLGTQFRVNAGTIILETADAGANAKIYFAGGPYVGVYYPVDLSSPLTKNALIDPLNPGTTGKNGTFIAVFQLINYDHSLATAGAAPAGSIFLGTAGLNNQAQDGSYTSMTVFTDGMYVRPCGGYAP